MKAEWKSASTTYMELCVMTSLMTIQHQLFVGVQKVGVYNTFLLCLTIDIIYMCYTVYNMDCLTNILI